jgi:hypothetical protein
MRWTLLALVLVPGLTSCAVIRDVVTVHPSMGDWVENWSEQNDPSDADGAVDAGVRVVRGVITLPLHLVDVLASPIHLPLQAWEVTCGTPVAHDYSAEELAAIQTWLVAAGVPDDESGAALDADGRLVLNGRVLGLREGDLWNSIAAGFFGHDQIWLEGQNHIHIPKGAHNPSVLAHEFRHVRDIQTYGLTFYQVTYFGHALFNLLRPWHWGSGWSMQAYRDIFWERRAYAVSDEAREYLQRDLNEAVIQEWGSSKTALQQANALLNQYLSAPTDAKLADEMGVPTKADLQDQIPDTILQSLNRFLGLPEG